MDVKSNSDLSSLSAKIAERENLEEQAAANLTTETLEKLCISIENLPQKCKGLLTQAANIQKSYGIKKLDPLAISLKLTQMEIYDMDYQYEVLKLKQKNEELELRIKKNRDDNEIFKKELEEAKHLLNKQNPKEILDEISVLNQKLISYEQNYNKTKQKFHQQNIPSEVYPKSIQTLINQLESLKQEEVKLKDKADHISLARTAKQKLLQLKNRHQ